MPFKTEGREEWGRRRDGGGGEVGRRRRKTKEGRKRETGDWGLGGTEIQHLLGRNPVVTVSCIPSKDKI